MTQQIMKKKSPSYDQFQLKNLCDLVCDDIENLLETLGISYKILDKMVTMSCPIHGGDNESACNLYHQGESYRGNWKCRTHQCEKVFMSSIIGFIRGCLSHNEHGWEKSGDKLVSFNEAVAFAISFTKQDISKLKVSKKEKEKSSFVNTVKYINESVAPDIPKISRTLIKKALTIPANYYLNQSEDEFSESILTKYDVGECLIRGKEMYNRAVVPIYDNDYEYMVGCSGRSLYARSCIKCRHYHDPNSDCPDKDNLWKYSKWKHSKGFKANEYLYNFWFAKKVIKESGVVILVESPGNVWRLEEAGIHNSVAIFGSSLGDRQKMTLDISGAMTIITIMDNDSAGKTAAVQIKEKCQRTYNIKNIELSYNDIAKMSKEQVVEEIKPLVEKFTLCQ